MSDLDHNVPRVQHAAMSVPEKKGGRTPREAGMQTFHTARRPSMYELQERGRRFPPGRLHVSWLDYLYWDIELEA